MVDAFATVPDLLRLVAVPILGWAAWRDLRTRRVPGWVWWPLIVIGLALIGWTALRVLGQPAPASQLFALRAGLSLGLLVPMALAFYRFNLIGGADAKAFIALAVLFPTYPAYDVGVAVLPFVRPPVGVFSLTILTNAALLGLLYPGWLVLSNLLDGEVSPAMVRARRVRWTDLPETHGRLAETPTGRTLQGLDLDALRMYLRWRDRTLVELRERPAELRDPAGVPSDPGDPTDGRLDGAERLEADLEVEVTAPIDPATVAESGDPWAAGEFLEAVGGAYGTTPAQLRQGLTVAATAERVWVSPGLPYLVPVFAGLLVGLVAGDLLYGGLQAVGLG